MSLVPVRAGCQRKAAANGLDTKSMKGKVVPTGRGAPAVKSWYDAGLRLDAGAEERRGALYLGHAVHGPLPRGTRRGGGLSVESGGVWA